MVDNQVWRDKDIRISRMGSIKASINLLDIAERLGLLDNEVKGLSELYTLQGELSDKIFEYIYKGMEK